MAVTMESTMAMQDDIMDIDIDMDIDDVGAGMAEDMLEEGEEPSFQPSHPDPSGVIPAIYIEDPATEPQWQKIHLRGVDDMHTNDILAFAKDYFPQADPHVQWVDDTSANLVFQDRATAQQALLALTESPPAFDSINASPFELRQAKQLASRPASILTLRIAQAGDRKKKNARDASRYYLLHPEEDPGERIRRESTRGRGENGDYKRRRFDEREHRRRRDQDHNAENEDFSAAMYDDAPTVEAAADGSRGRDLFSRITTGRRRSASPSADLISENSSDEGRLKRRRNGYRDRSNPPPYTRRDPHPHPRTNVGKELFGDPVKQQSAGNGTLHSDLTSTSATKSLTSEQRQTNSAAAKRLKADLMASVSNRNNNNSQPQTSPRSHGHRRSHAMDAKNDEDLAERFGRKSMSMDSTKSVTAKTQNSGMELFPKGNSNSNNNGGSGLNIRGAAAAGGEGGLSIKGSSGFSIKGRAGADQVKELFPDQYSRGLRGKTVENKGKELFDEPVRRKVGRQRAGDLFD